MYRRCAPSAAETGRASLGVQSSVLGRPTLIPLTDRTQLARPPITCASCAENACLIRLNAVSEQGQVRVVKWRFRASISSSGKLLSRIAILLSIFVCVCLRQLVQYVVDDDAVDGDLHPDAQWLRRTVRNQVCATFSTVLPTLCQIAFQCRSFDPSLRRLNRSSFRLIAFASRFCVFCNRKTIRNVTMLVTLLMISCHVSE
jgi:hypothetical protein